MTTVVMETLTDSERAEFVMLEARIKRGLSIFYEIGAALLTIRDKRLYRADYSNFEAYCVERWEMGRRYANMLIAASDVVENLKGTAVPLPEHETHVRPLTGLEPDDQRIVWQVMDLAAKELGVKQSTTLTKSVVAVLKSGVLTGTVDGETTLTEAAKNAIVYEFAEIRERQKAHIQEGKPKPLVFEGALDGNGVLEFFTDANTSALKAGVRYRFVVYEVSSDENSVEGL
jgi:hypothetical protein